MGFQYSDESDSEHRSGDESLEDHHDTASDRTLSKGRFLIFLLLLQDQVFE